MKRIFKTIGLGALVFTFFYLLGVFYNVNFNISNWDFSSRLTISILGGFFSAFLMSWYFSYNGNERNT